MRLSNTLTGILCAGLLAGLAACKKSDPAPPAENHAVTVNILYAADGLPLETDTIKYTNAAGNMYSVSRLEYYLSGFSLQDMQGNWWGSKKIYYINARMPAANTFSLEGFPEGSYKSMKVYIGLAPENNTSGCLDPTPENLNMAWPDMMGGGYHFLKLEGHFNDTAGKKQGYAMHIGRNECLVTAELPVNFTHSGSLQLRLQMNINEWLANPHTYNFNVQGNYTMGVDSLMNQLKQNGADVFTYIP